MSTELKTIKTLTRHDKTPGVFATVETHIGITAFWGGFEKGRCLQMSIAGIQRDNFNTPYLHLTVDEAMALRKELTKFIEKEY